MKTFPRLDRLRVTNFQSLDSADVELGSFTVIVGPSNSGKSALLRALKAVVRNVNSPSAVRVGKTLFTAALEFDGTTVSIERGKSQSTYRINLPDGSEEVYTKAGRTVPEDVQAVLALPLPEGPDITFSSQIDPPFLLAETGTTSAKILGDLTNVSKLHAASREANRRRLEASKVLKIRQEDAVAAAAQLKEQFSDLPATKKVLAQARTEFDSITSMLALREKLEKSVESLALLDQAESDLRTRLGELPQPADIEALAEKAGSLLGKRHALIDSLGVLARLADAEPQLLTIKKASEKESEEAQKAYHDTLVQAGQCPTCGSEISA